MTESEAIELIKKALSFSKNPIVAFSGGKDSTVVLHLVRKIAENVPAQFSNTGVEHQDTVAFCRTIPNLRELHPIKSFWDCVRDYGLPRQKDKGHTHGNRCCLYLKDWPANEDNKKMGFDLVFTGLTISESRQRRLSLMRLGNLYKIKSGIWKCHPIWNWSEAEVWDYIRANKIPYNPIYDKGARRCGCQPCTAYLSWKKNLARENPKLLRYILKIQGQSQLGDQGCNGGA